MRWCALASTNNALVRSATGYRTNVGHPYTTEGVLDALQYRTCRDSELLTDPSCIHYNPDRDVVDNTLPNGQAGPLSNIYLDSQYSNYVKGVFIKDINSLGTTQLRVVGAGDYDIGGNDLYTEVSPPEDGNALRGTRSREARAAIPMALRTVTQITPWRCA
eukprot:scaffold3664_cov407-Prasinococcus_capsulatus_cf.AAC.18